MPAQVALLYSIVIGPGSRVVMADLRAMAADLGLGQPRTLLATGNMLFAAHGDARSLETLLEAAFVRRFGKHVDIIIRPGADWPRLLAGNPFPEAAAREPSRVAARVMRAPLKPKMVQILEPYRVDGERIAVVDGDLWVHFPLGQGASRLAGAITPARVGGAGTFRNWNTLRKIGAALAG